MVLHVTTKNAGSCVAGVGAVPLTIFGIFVPASQWTISPWKWIALGLLAAVVGGLILQLLLSSKEDHDREEWERKQEQRQEGMDSKIDAMSQIIVHGTFKSLPSSVPTSNVIQPIQPPVTFNAQQFFQQSHQSAWTADVENRIKIAASQNVSVMGNTENFYAKFIGVGLVSYLHDITWAYIWRSQFLMLDGLNRNSGILPIQEVQKFYDRGKLDFPGHYMNYSFDQWLGFVQANELVIRHSSEMVEISVRGRDFLVYCAHNSRVATDRWG